MAKEVKKSGQKLAKRFSRFSRKAAEDGVEHIKENIVERAPHARSVRLLIVEWWLLVSVVILLAVTQAFWYSDSYSTQAFVRGGTFTEGDLGEVSSLNPLFASTDSEQALSKLLFSTLSENDYSGRPGLGLAESITADESGKTWTVRLRDGLKWSDGEPLTIEDVLFTIELIKNPDVSTIYSTNLSGVSASIVDDSTISFKLSSSYVDFASALNFPILPKHILADISPALLLESDFSKNPVSSGAFKFNATQTIGTSGEVIVYLSANEHYYRSAPLLSSFAVHAFLDKESMISALNSGSITAAAGLSDSDAAKITSKTIFERQTSISSGVYAFMNTTSGVFKNRTLRRAVQQGVDTDAVRYATGDDSLLPLDYPITSNQISITTWPTLLSYDPANANATVANNGISAESAPINLVTVNSGSLPVVAAAFAEQLRNLGFNVQVTTYEPSQEFIMNVIRPRSYDILIYEIELGAEPDLFAYYHSSQASTTGLNLSNYSNTMANDLILGVRSTMDEYLRDAKYASFLEYWVSDAPAIGLYQSNFTYFYNKNARIFSEDTSLVEPIDRFVEIEYWSVTKSTKNRTP